MADPIGELSESFERACEARPAQLSNDVFRVGGASVHARVAGLRVAALLRRSLPPGDSAGPAALDGARLRLELWDEEATGVARATVTRQQDGIVRPGPAGEQLGFSDEGRYFHYAGTHFDIRLDRLHGRAVGWLRSERLLSSWHRARPLQTLLIPWLAGRGVTIVHAAMVARDGAGVLLAGPPHSGKSTATAACGEGGLDLLGDETIALDLHDHAVLGHCVHAAVKLRRAGLERHPTLVSRVHGCGPPWQDDAVAFLNEVYPRQVVASSEVAALGFPTLGTRAQSAVSPLPSGHAMRVLTGCLLSVEPGNVADAFATVADVVQRLPSYRIVIGTDTASVPEAIDGLLTQLAAARA
jgi:hypothetical protein